MQSNTGILTEDVCLSVHQICTPTYVSGYVAADLRLFCLVCVKKFV